MIPTAREIIFRAWKEVTRVRKVCARVRAIVSRVREMVERVRAIIPSAIISAARTLYIGVPQRMFIALAGFIIFLPLIIYKLTMGEENNKGNILLRFISGNKAVKECSRPLS